MPRKPRNQPRNRELVPGVNRFSRSTMFHKKGKWAIKNKQTVKKKEEIKPVVKPFGKKGETRTIKPKGPKFYPADYVPHRLEKTKKHPIIRLRSSIKPGSVLIVLAGRFKGKRVVFIKQLPSGLLLVTGPFKVNGVPIRRVNQAYVIATSTSIDISGITIDPKFDDSFFKKPKKEKKAKSETDFFATETEKKHLDKAQVESQKAFDTPIMNIIKNQPHLRSYLKAKFSLSRGQFPHDLKF